MPPLVVYVDVDDTFVRHVGSTQIPIPATIRHVRELQAQGADLYCWSTGGADYARLMAAEAGIADCFAAFLPKPNVLLDDQSLVDWRQCIEVGPGEAGRTVEEYRAAISSR